jgi:H+-transporting ATPase
MYLKLSVAGHLTIFLTRTRGPFWSIRPARILWIAVLGTQTIATLIAVYGLFMTPLGWRWAGFVWGYAIICALATDRVKLLAYKILDPVKAESKPQAKSLAKPAVKTEPKPEAKDEPKADAKVEPKPEAKAAPKPEVKAVPPADLTPQIAKRAYELYEERGSKGGHSVQDWEKAEQEIQKDEPKVEPKPEAEVEPNPEASAEPKPEAKGEPPADLKLHIVKRVHELYEELGREDVREVEAWEKEDRETRENEPHK